MSFKYFSFFFLFKYNFQFRKVYKYYELSMNCSIRTIFNAKSRFSWKIYIIPIIIIIICLTITSVTSFFSFTSIFHFSSNTYFFLNFFRTTTMYECIHLRA